jgi:hypothetical protein
MASIYDWKKDVGVMSAAEFYEYVGVVGKVKDEGGKLQPVDVLYVLFEDNLYATQKGRLFKDARK